MNEHNEEALSESGFEQAVRATLDRQATTVPPQEPPVAQLLKQGRKRRRMRDTLSVTGAVVMVCAGAIGVHAVAAPGNAHSEQAAGKGGVVGVTTRPAAGGAASADGANGYHATVPKSWKPGPKLPLSTYASVPNWVQTADAAAELGTDEQRGHHVNLGMSPDATTCLSLGSDPILWPQGFYAEGTPLVVFDPAGRPVYVVDQGFTGTDGPAKIGYGDGVHLLPGLDMTSCPGTATSALEPIAIAMIFPDPAQK